MNVYDQMRQLTPGQMQAVWTQAVKKGMVFHIGKMEYRVMINGKKILRLKDENGKSYTFKRYTNRFMSNGKETALMRDIEGLIVCDLLNEYNPFHEISDVFKMTEQVIGKT